MYLKEIKFELKDVAIKRFISLIILFLSGSFARTDE